MPSLRMPGFGTSMRTLAVRIVGSSTGPMSLMRPVNTLPGYALSVNLRLLSETNFGKIVFVDVADDPDDRQIGDGECRR